MKKPMPPSIARLLNDAAIIPEAVETLWLNIPTSSADPKTRWKEARSEERRAARNARTDFSGPEYELPF